MVKIELNDIWNKDFRIKQKISVFKQKENRFRHILKDEMKKENKQNTKKQKIGYERLNNMGYIIISFRYTGLRNESSYMITKKTINDAKMENIIKLKNCPQFIDIYIERLEKNDNRVQRLGLDLSVIKTKTFYEIELIRNILGKKTREYINVFY